MGRFTSTRTTEQWGDERLLEVEAILQRHLQIQFHLNPGSTGASAENGEGSAPHNQVYFRSSWDLGCNRQFDLALRYVDNVPAVNVPSYLVGDTRVAWRARENLALSVVAQSFFDNHHPEFTGFLVAGAGAQVSGDKLGTPLQLHGMYQFHCQVSRLFQRQGDQCTVINAASSFD